METKSSEIISWEASEFVHHAKNPLWYIGFAVLAGALIVYGIFSGSLITIIMFALIVALAFVYAHRKPRTMNHDLTLTGIILGDTMYPYKSIRKFWIIYEPPQVKTLNIETGSYLNSHVTIQLGDQDPVAVKMFLKNYLIEDLNREESFVDIIARRLRL
jgi:hypothetical protein